MALDWLEFDFTEDEHGHGSFDAMASASAAQLPALEAEIVRVLGWARAQFGAPAPLEEGGAWDYELQAVQEVATPLVVAWSVDGLAKQLGAAGAPRVTWSLTLTGAEEFCAALRSEFGAG